MEPEVFPGDLLALVCGEAELRRRMSEGRKISDAGWISDSVEYNNYFLEHDRLGDIAFERLDITVLRPEQAAERVEIWIRSKLSIWTAGKTARMPGLDARMPEGREEKPETRTMWMGGSAGISGTDLAGKEKRNIEPRMPWLGGNKRASKENPMGRDGKNAGSGAPWLGGNQGMSGEEQTGRERKNAGSGAPWLGGNQGMSGKEQTGRERKNAGFGAPWLMGDKGTSGAAAGMQQEGIIMAETRQEPQKKGSRWIWCYGDFELFHSLKLHARRDEFDHNFPPFWRLDDCRHNVRFKKDVELKDPEVITVHAYGVGNVEVDGKRHAFGTPVYLSGGKHTIVAHVLNRDGLPCIYAEGETVASDESWLANCYGREWGNAGSREDYADRMDNPQIFKFCYEKIEPVEKKQVDGGILYDFGKETFAKLRINAKGEDVDVFYGETQEEALDIKHSYLRAHVRDQEIPGRAFRYLYLKTASKEDCKVQAYYEYLPLKRRGSFCCSDEMFNKIWETAAYTFHLNSREFFLDGIKRDRWVWSGDAYQSYLINRYLFFDADICRRTILALRGLDPVEKHINTIMDYSFYWLMSIYDYYEMTGDGEFVRQVYPKMKSLMDFCMARCNAEGFAVQVEDDWVFIDWADMDKEGAVCAEQMLLAKALEATAKCAGLAGDDPMAYRTAFAKLREKIDRFFWDEEKGAYIDSFASGRRNVTRHANIFALLFGFADEVRQRRIIDHVLQNDEVPQIRTPYFKFYELEALCHMGKMEEVTGRIQAYWGAMLSAGATSFWEEYTPKLPWEEQLGMYGDKYGKSLCHAWGASPVYLAGRYYLGVRPTAAGYRTFEVAPNPGGLAWFEGSAPVGKGKVEIRFRGGVLEVCTDVDGGVLVWENRKYALAKGVTKRIPSF